MISALSTRIGKAQPINPRAINDPNVHPGAQTALAEGRGMCVCSGRVAGVGALCQTGSLGTLSSFHDSNRLNLLFWRLLSLTLPWGDRDFFSPRPGALWGAAPVNTSRAVRMQETAVCEPLCWDCAFREQHLAAGTSTKPREQRAVPSPCHGCCAPSAAWLGSWCQPGTSTVHPAPLESCKERDFPHLQLGRADRQA